MSARLLLVEDETSLAVGLVDVLKVKGYHIDHADNGEEDWPMALRGRLRPAAAGRDAARPVRL